MKPTNHTDAESFVVPVLPAASRPSDMTPAGAAGERAVDDLAQDAGDAVGDLALEHLGAVGAGHGEVLAVAVGDARDRDRLAARAVVGEGGVRAGHRQRRDLVGAEGERRARGCSGVAVALAHAEVLGDGGRLHWPTFSSSPMK